MPFPMDVATRGPLAQRRVFTLLLDWNKRLIFLPPCSLVIHKPDYGTVKVTNMNGTRVSGTTTKNLEEFEVLGGSSLNKGGLDEFKLYQEGQNRFHYGAGNAVDGTTGDRLWPANGVQVLVYQFNIPNISAILSNSNHIYEFEDVNNNINTESYRKNIHLNLNDYEERTFLKQLPGLGGSSSQIRAREDDQAKETQTYGKVYSIPVFLISSSNAQLNITLFGHCTARQNSAG
ncbi:hypothetical protein C8R41DRAFT_869822 [Lentinula lateritia]|uniref:Galactose mutarotase-like protein n=1 Tax=Lentinula lateritia TaxID=40482 RepID=A0ABQ8VB94_9AGAR|nr:hypothetical protein C8R41DRAFT_869822 [Lentinula lateritia]